MFPIALLTDFGTQDSYVGVMKGVIAGIAPGAPLLDLSHAIRPQAVAHAAYTLAIAAPYFPPGTIFCCVVDPGVGSARRAIAARVGPWTVVAPDNGLLSRLADDYPVRAATSLDAPRFHLPSRSATFHGRDLFAPVAAHLARGTPLEALGSALAVERLVRLPAPPTEPTGQGWQGAVQHVDHFGNLITTLRGRDVGDLDRWQLAVPAVPLLIPRLSRTYAEVAVGEPLAYLGSDGFIEIAIRNGNAAEQWGVACGEAVQLRPRP